MLDVRINKIRQLVMHIASIMTKTIVVKVSLIIFEKRFSKEHKSTTCTDSNCLTIWRRPSLTLLIFRFILNLFFLWGIELKILLSGHICLISVMRFLNSTKTNSESYFSVSLPPLAPHCKTVLSGIELFDKTWDILQSGAAAKIGDRTYRQIWGPNVNNNIYILTHEYSSTGFE